MTTDQLQLVVRHEDYTTTQRYISMAAQMSQAVEKLDVPILADHNVS